MQKQIDELVQCPKCNSKLFKEVWQIHKIMCNKNKKTKTIQKNKTSQSFFKFFQGDREPQQKKQQCLIPCIECGESVPFELYGIHELQCIGQQLVQCRNCGIKFPTFLIQQHNEVCQGKQINHDYQLQQNSDDQDIEQIGNNEQLLALIQNLALESDKMKEEGLNQKQLKSLKSCLIIRQQQCPICCTKMRKLNRNIKLGCKHIFHKSCIQPWLAKNPKCPMCRQHALKK